MFHVKPPPEAVQRLVNTSLRCSQSAASRATRVECSSSTDERCLLEDSPATAAKMFHVKPPRSSQRLTSTSPGWLPICRLVRSRAGRSSQTYERFQLEDPSAHGRRMFRVKPSSEAVNASRAPRQDGSQSAACCAHVSDVPPPDLRTFPTRRSLSPRLQNVSRETVPRSSQRLISTSRGWLPNPAWCAPRVGCSSPTYERFQLRDPPARGRRVFHVKPSPKPANFSARPRELRVS